MLYRLRTDGAVLSQGEVRKLFPNTSFPAVWDASVCDAIGVDPVEMTAPPSITPYQKAVMNGADLVEGKWTQTWIIQNYDEAQIQATNDYEWARVRDQRNKLLANSDWTQLQDAPVDDRPWATYRQALRDITQQSDPFNITWPTSP